MAAPRVDDPANSFECCLWAGNKSPRTIETYLEAVRGFAAYLAATSGHTLDQTRREDVEAWISILLQRWKSATAHNRYRDLHAFYRWLEGGPESHWPTTAADAAPATPTVASRPTIGCKNPEKSP